MLFRRKIPRSCTYCKFAAKLGDEQILCSKKGIVLSSDSACRKFRYDLLKRSPKDKPGLGEFQAVSLDD